MALSRAAWIAAGLVARLLMIAVLAMAVQIRFATSPYYDYKAAGFNEELRSYTYVVAAAVIGMAGCLLQIPVAVYLLCKSKKIASNVLTRDISTYADIVVTVVLASGVGAGFGATLDVLKCVDYGFNWQGDVQAYKKDLKHYYNKESVGIVFLLAGMVLSVCATVVSVRLRARAADDLADH